MWFCRNIQPWMWLQIENEIRSPESESFWITAAMVLKGFRYQQEGLRQHPTTCNNMLHRPVAIHKPYYKHLLIYKPVREPHGTFMKPPNACAFSESESSAAIFLRSESMFDWALSPNRSRTRAPPVGAWIRIKHGISGTASTKTAKEQQSTSK